MPKLNQWRWPTTTRAASPPIRELLLADPAARLYDLIVDNIISLQADSTLMEASDVFGRYSFRAIPVVDAADRILGVVTYRDIRNLKHRFLE